MTPDLSQLVLITTENTFKNNNVFPGSFVISGNHGPGVTIHTFTVNLGVTLDIDDILFNGPADPTNTDPRPANGWFKVGAVYEPTADGGGGIAAWTLNSSLNGSQLTITALYVQQYTGTYTSTPISFSYRVIDYSVF